MEEIIQNIHFTNLLWTIITPIILIVLDVLTGIITAWKNNNFQSAKMREGLSKKFGEIVYILVGIVSKFALGTEIILYFTVSYICIMEISSLLENSDKLGIPIPNNIKDKINNK